MNSEEYQQHRYHQISAKTGSAHLVNPAIPLPLKGLRLTSVSRRSLRARAVSERLSPRIRAQ